MTTKTIQIPNWLGKKNGVYINYEYKITKMTEKAIGIQDSENGVVKTKFDKGGFSTKNEVNVIWLPKSQIQGEVELNDIINVVRI